MRITSVVFTILVALLAVPLVASAQRTEKVQEPVSLHAPVISGDGAWVATEERSDGSNGHVRVRSTDGAVTYMIARGRNPRISRDSRWVSALQKTPVQEADTNGDSSKRVGQTLILLDTKDGSRRTFEFVMSYDITYTSSYLIYLQSPEVEAERGKPVKDKVAKSAAKQTSQVRELGTLHVVHLKGDKVLTIKNVKRYIPHLTHANHQTNDHYAYVLHDEKTGRDTLHMALVNPGPDNRGNFGTRGIHTGHRIEGLRWAQDSATAVFLDRNKTTGKDGKPQVSSVLYTWHDVPGRPGQREFVRINTSK